MAITTINTTGRISHGAVRQALQGFAEGAEPGEFVRVELQSPSQGTVELDNLRVNAWSAISGDVYVRASFASGPNQGGPFTGWIKKGDRVSIWQTIEVDASNFESVF